MWTKIGFQSFETNSDRLVRYLSDIFEKFCITLLIDYLKVFLNLKLIISVDIDDLLITNSLLKKIGICKKLLHNQVQISNIRS